MSRANPSSEPQSGQPEFDIFHGADRNDIGEIDSAIKADSNALNAREPTTGKTAAIIAAADGNYAALHHLIETHKADPWIRDNRGWLALDYARAIGHQGCRQLLLVAMYPELIDEADTPPHSTPSATNIPKMQP